MSVIPPDWLTRFRVAPAPISNVPALSARVLTVMLVGPVRFRVLPAEFRMVLYTVVPLLLGTQVAGPGVQLHCVAVVQFPVAVDQVAVIVVGPVGDPTVRKASLAP